MPVETMNSLPRSLEEKDWKVLLQRIRTGRCIPFLGAGACHGALPLGGDIASQWAKENNYPLDDKNDLARVAQFLAVEYDPFWPKIDIVEKLSQARAPDFSVADEPHALLSELPLPIYMTTNYDDFMTLALKRAKKSPKPEYCRWNRFLQDQPTVFDAGFSPDVANPLVYHLHGALPTIESMVLTEDDYLDFMVNLAHENSVIPHQLQKALAESSLLFLGYKLADWDFRVLFRSLITYMERSLSKVHMSVQLVPVGDLATEEQKLHALNYLDKYFGKSDVRVYWGSCRSFSRELRTRSGL